ncbi:protein lifeguard 3-like [Daktulosphaira vitifoliae]|uniref:protein lifeguard 3-like n=1 Tax=Daktulosphaira vitifoliae TaxID=58002 RepID=UPI0021A9A609|nr:protein lifeguard 3-like [Daktulosphaira vitifoliae]XP_050529998.1 protein lifeguard 3-like [Daktulosphaira vitifoliae]XP_050529999.1 protein lifeguard 3-like [Daktulosphaira vitifoliae]
MLAIVFGEILFFIISPEAKDFLKKYILLCVILSLYMYIVSMYAISCYENVRRTVPLNFIVLTIMSMSLGVVISCACIHYQLRIIILAICYTFALSLSVSILAAYCPIDITKFGVLIFVMGAIILIMAVITSFLLSHVYFEYKKAEIILGAVGVFVFSIYLAYDTQLIMGGRKEEISPAEYVLAVVILFTDIINIFMCMLNLINGEEG